MVMESVLVTGRFIVLENSCTITFSNFLEGKSYLLSGIENSMSIFGGQIIDILKMIIGDNNDVGWVIADEEGADVGRHEIVFVNNV